MKRIGRIYDQIISVENLTLADKIAQKGKRKQYGVIRHNRNKEQNIINLHESLKNKTYQTSQYSIFNIYEPKEREIFRLPYYPDRIVHHAIMNVLEPMFIRAFTADTYSCIKGRGIHSAVKKVKSALTCVEDTSYCLKLDIKKFYPSVDHEILKVLLRRKLKDKDLLWLLDGIIDSAPGLPIGNYLSQYFANFYLTYFDHWIKETLNIKHYFRYADDIVILSRSKEYLHEILRQIKEYLQVNLKLEVKGNYQVFPVEKRGIDFLGYKFFHAHILLRKSIKQNFARAVSRGAAWPTLASYLGWSKHANSKHLIKKLTTKNEKLFRAGDKTISPGVDRRQNKDRSDSRQGDRSTLVQSGAIEVQ